MIRVILPVLTFFSLFFFPYLLSGFLILASAALLPFSGLALGILADVLYYSSDTVFMPVWSIGGAVATIISLLMQRFVKTRIMEL